MVMNPRRGATSPRGEADATASREERFGEVGPAPDRGLVGLLVAFSANSVNISRSSKV